ncbi:MAG: CBS domain-containing protein, partial [Oscillospiraceae bacterium]
MIVRDIMSPGVTTVTQDDTAFKAATLMKNHNIGAIPVMCGKKVCGMVTDRDIVLRCIASGKD